MAGSGTIQLRPERNPLLSVRGLTVEFPAADGKSVHAVSDVSLDILAGETLGFVGESGCGKSTLGRAIMQYLKPRQGQVMLEGRDLTLLAGEELRRVRPRLQMIFQDPLSSLNPRRRIRDIVAEPLRIWPHLANGNVEARVDLVLESVGLDPVQVGDRRPRQFSGGQAQRISIARALILDPSLLICDEPVSALDVSVQAQILNLLEDAKAEFGLTMMFIAHDLAVVKNVSDRIGVMYLGKLCEIGDSRRVFDAPAHPYTKALLESIPEIDPRATPKPPPLEGEVASAIDPPSGCRFRTRCPRATDVCVSVEPPMRQAGPDHFAACHHPLIPLEDVVGRVDRDGFPSAQSAG